MPVNTRKKSGDIWKHPVYKRHLLLGGIRIIKLKVAGFLDMAPCKLVYRYVSFEGFYCLRLHGGSRTLYVGEFTRNSIGLS